MVNSHADMLVPGSNELRFAQARSSVSCTRSSARSTLPHNEIAKARRLGTARNIASLTDGLGGILTIPCCSVSLFPQMGRPQNRALFRIRDDESGQRSDPERPGS